MEAVNADFLVTDLRQAQWKKWHDTRTAIGSTDEDDSVLDHDLEGRV